VLQIYLQHCTLLPEEMSSRYT